MMVPALAEQHAAHKARRERMTSPAPVPVKPPVYVRTTIPIPQPVQISGTRKHQIAILAAAGYSQGRIAKRLDLTVGVVAGVLYRLRTEQHRLLLSDCIIMMFELGFDTADIAEHIGEPEDVAANALVRYRSRLERDSERAR